MAGAGLLATSGTRVAQRWAGAGLMAAGAVCTRWSVFKAGFQAARDPAHVVAPQRGGR